MWLFYCYARENLDKMSNGYKLFVLHNYYNYLLSEILSSFKTFKTYMIRNDGRTKIS